jgi:hypothetical protein
LNAHCEEAAGSGVPRKALNADEQKGIDRQYDSEEELTPRCVIGGEVVSPAEYEQADNERPHDDGEECDLALDRSAFSLDQATPICLTSCLLSQRAEHCSSARSTLDGDE